MSACPVLPTLPTLSCRYVHLVPALTFCPCRSYLAIPASSWVDDFIDWLTPASLLSTSCCRIYSWGSNKDQFCPSTVSECQSGEWAGALVTIPSAGLAGSSVLCLHWPHAVWGRGRDEDYHLLVAVQRVPRGFLFLAACGEGIWSSW